jgi:hypothetical protein
MTYILICSLFSLSLCTHPYIHTYSLSLSLSLKHAHTHTHTHTHTHFIGAVGEDFAGAGGGGLCRAGERV